MSSELKYAVSVKRAHYHNQKGAKGWQIYGYDEKLRFCTRRISWTQAIFNKPKLYDVREFTCADCGNRFRRVFNKGIFVFLMDGKKIRRHQCEKCERESP